MNILGFDPERNDSIRAKMYETGAVLARIAAIKGAEDKIDGKPSGRPGSITMLGQLMHGPLRTLAALVSKLNPKTEEEAMAINPGDGITSETILFAALLLVEMAPDNDPNSDTFKSEFGPHVVWEAMVAYEKLTGKKPDEHLCPGMVKAARNIGQIGADGVKAMMALRGGNTPPTLQ